LLLKLGGIGALVVGTLFVLRPQPVADVVPRQRVDLEQVLTAYKEADRDVPSYWSQFLTWDDLVAPGNPSAPYSGAFPNADASLDDFALDVLDETSTLEVDVFVVNRGRLTATGVRVVAPQGWIQIDGTVGEFELAPGETATLTYARDGKTLSASIPVLSDTSGFRVDADHSTGIPNPVAAYVFGGLAIVVTAMVTGFQIHKDLSN
jgi:hypothetical protein